MKSFYSEQNIIEQILKNDPNYTNLKITNEHINHYYVYDTQYMFIYAQASFDIILINALNKNSYISSICTCLYPIFEFDENIKLLLQRPFKSINLYKYGRSIIDYLHETQNYNVEKLELCPVSFNGDKIAKYIEMNKSLKHLILDDTWWLETNVQLIIKSLKYSTLETLTLKRDIFDVQNWIICDIIKTNSKIKQLYICDAYHTNLYDIKDALLNNFNIIDFKINNVYHDEFNEILERNKKYQIMLHMCINKRIIPKCVSLNCLLPFVL